MFTIITKKRLAALEEEINNNYLVLEQTQDELDQTTAKLDLLIKHLDLTYASGNHNKPHFRSKRCDSKK